MPCPALLCRPPKFRTARQFDYSRPSSSSRSNATSIAQLFRLCPWRSRSNMATIFVAPRESNSSLLAASWPGWQARLDKAHPGRQALTRAERLFHPRQPELFCAAELFFSHFSGGGVSHFSGGGVMVKRPGKTRASDAWGTESTPVRTERIQFKVSPDEITAIDEFRFQTRMPNRATAIRELLRRGLGAPKTERG